MHQSINTYNVPTASDFFEEVLADDETGSETVDSFIRRSSIDGEVRHEMRVMLQCTVIRHSTSVTWRRQPILQAPVDRN